LDLANAAKQTGKNKMAGPLLLRGGRIIRTGSARPECADILIGRDGRIARIGQGLAQQEANTIDLSNALVSPGFIDVHQHLDKTRTRRVVPNPSGTLRGAVTAFNDYAAHISEDDLIRRAEQTLESCLRRGTVAVRTHANIDSVLTVRAVEALIKLRERWRDRIRVQVVAFVTADATRMGDAAKAWLDAAISAGADVVGGTPAISDKPLEFLDMLFDTAAATGLPIDLHLDEHLDAERQLFDAVIARTKTRKLGGRVAVGHCSALSAMPQDRARRVIDGFAEASISVITLPSANLFLQGRDSTVLPPRGLTRVSELLAAGVRVAAASDNIQDPFVPVGTGDMLEIARWTLLAGHLGLSDIGKAHTMITRAPAEIMGFDDDYGLREGARADLIVSEAEDVEDLVASGPPLRQVLVGGRPAFGTL
jgi:cytosine/creatinine deaminase